MAAKKSFSDRVKGRRQSKNVIDKREETAKEARRAKAKSEKEMMDIFMPHNETIKAKDLKKVKPDDATKLVNKIMNSDPGRATRLKNYKSDTKPTRFKK